MRGEEAVLSRFVETLTVISLAAILFNHLKTEIDKYVEEYGNERSPPPWQVFTIANNIGPGNLHLVQKVFEGSFEVGHPIVRRKTSELIVEVRRHILV